MNVKMLARPDHSVGLYKDLLKRKINIEYFTFYAAREGSMMNKLLPRRKTVPSSANTLDFFTVLSYISNKIGQRSGYNWRKLESSFANYCFSKLDFTQTDIVHYWPFYTTKVIRDLKSNASIPTLAEFYEAEPSFVNEIYNSEYERFSLPTTQHINLMIDQNECFSFENNFAVASNFTAETYKRLYPDKNFHILKYGPIGCSLDSKIIPLLEKKSSDNNNRIVFVGQVCLEKGVHYLIEAIRDTPYVLDLIGPVRQNQKNIFKEFKNIDNVNFIGAKRNSEVIDMLSNYKAFVLPSLSDNYSLAVNEALSAGLPVIVTENCGNKDDINNYGLGYVVDVKSSDALSVAIQSVFNDFDWSGFSIGLKRFFDDELHFGYVDRAIDTYSILLNENQY